MKRTGPPDKLETKDGEMLSGVPGQLFSSLVPLRTGWFANHALLTAAGCRSSHC